MGDRDKMNCLCCKKRLTLKTMGHSTKGGKKMMMCTNCSLYNKNIRLKLLLARYEISKLRKKLYGFDKPGNERIRWK